MPFADNVDGVLYTEAVRGLEPGEPSPSVLSVALHPRFLVVTNSLGARILDRSSGALAGGVEHLGEAHTLEDVDLSHAAVFEDWAVISSPTTLYGLDLTRL